MQLYLSWLNTGLRSYRPQQVRRLPDERKIAKVQSPIRDDVWSGIVCLLQQDWSTEQISLWLKAGYGIVINHEWIYQYILQDKICACGYFQV